MFITVVNDKIVYVQPLTFNVIKVPYLNNRNIFKVYLCRKEAGELIDKLKRIGIDSSVVKVEWLD